MPAGDYAAATAALTDYFRKPNYLRADDGRPVASDFDERPRHPLLIQDRSKIRYYRDQTISLFGQGVAKVRSDIESSTRISPVDNLVSIHAWNEWHEGGIIEPNAVEGCAYLDVIRAQLRLKSGGGCVARP